MSRILIPEYLLNFARDIYEGPLPSDFGERLIDRKDIQVLQNWYKLFGGKIPANQGKRMVPNYLKLFIQNLANAEILEVVDDDIAYIKETPQNALKYAFINKVGGMSYKGDFEGIRDSLVTSVNDTTLTSNEDKYGWGINEDYYNYRDYDNNKGHVKVTKVKIKDLVGLSFNSEYNVAYVLEISNMKSRPILNLLMSELETVDIIYTEMPNLSVAGTQSKGLNMRDTSCENLEAFLAKYGESYLYYPLETEQVEDIEGIEQVIDVSNNATFNNEYEQEVPSEITYYVRS